MGEARRRGTFEDRKAAAIERKQDEAAMPQRIARGIRGAFGALLGLVLGETFAHGPADPEDVKRAQRRQR